MNIKFSPIPILISVLLAGAAYCGAVWLLRHVWMIVNIATGSQQLSDIFRQLEDAVISVPVLFEAVFALIVGGMLTAVFGCKRMSLKIFAVVLTVLLELICFGLTIYMSRVNGVPVRVITGILITLVESGVI